MTQVPIASAPNPSPKSKEDLEKEKEDLFAKAGLYGFNRVYLKQEILKCYDRISQINKEVSEFKLAPVPEIIPADPA